MSDNSKEPVLHYVVVFHKVISLNAGLSQEACEKLFSFFKFSKRGEEYFFDKNANPQYSNHRVRSLLTLRQDEILEVDNIDMKLVHEGKTYNTVCWLSNISYLNPFHIKGVLNNEFCRAPYIVLSDDLDDNEKPALYI